MKGELGYKDIHGRVWLFKEADELTHSRWSAETPDKGHTEEYFHVASDVELLLGVLDEEPFLTDGKASEPLITEPVIDAVTRVECVEHACVHMWEDSCTSECKRFDEP